MTDLTDVIDLRNAVDGRSPADATTHIDGPERPHADQPDDDRDHEQRAADEARTHRRRRLIVVVIFALLLVVALDMVVGAANHAEHQKHLAAEIKIPMADPQVGEASFVLQAPAIGLNEVVVEGSSPGELRGGPGRRLDSVVPGDAGNTVIQAHSVRFGGPFDSLSDLKAGNSLYLFSRAKEVTAYKVTRVRVVGSGDVKYLEAGGPSRLTLVTSAGWPLDGHRVVVTAVADDIAKDGEDTTAAASTTEASSASQEKPAYDVRGLGGVVLLLAGVGLIAVGVLGAGGLRREYGTVTVAVVAGCPIVLGLALIYFNVSTVLPTTY